MGTAAGSHYTSRMCHGGSQTKNDMLTINSAIGMFGRNSDRKYGKYSGKLQKIDSGNRFKIYKMQLQDVGCVLTLKDSNMLLTDMKRI